MKHEKQVEILKDLQLQLAQSTTHDAGLQYRQDTSVYTCPDIAKREWGTLFRDQPHLIGLSGDLPEAGH